MRILVTGGSGFLGRGILRLSKSLGWEVTVYSRDEYKQDLCKTKYSANYVLGDINDYDRLVNACRGHELVIHTAAIKFIPEAEQNVLETIKVNVDGSLNVFKACEQAGVKQCVAISTDKSTMPVNTYGMTKALVERMVGEFSLHGLCEFYSCRYGNVIGSTGSVIPRFTQQVQETGRVTITDPDMTRYWISIDDAVSLITNSLKIIKPGSVLIPEPASMKLLDLAHVFTHDIEIIGPRPGEKKHESLLHPQESTRARNIGGFYELFSSLHEAVSEPFELSSDKPKHWLTQEEMLVAIEEAKLV